MTLLDALPLPAATALTRALGWVASLPTDERDALVDALLGVLNPGMQGEFSPQLLAESLSVCRDVATVKRAWADTANQRRVAFHEAGHVVAAIDGGLPLLQAVVGPDQAGALGSCRFADGGIHPVQSREHAERIAVMQLAGPLAEHHANLGGPSPDSMDLHRALADEALAMALPTWSPHARGLLRTTCEQRAEDLLDLNRPWVATVAESLMTCGKLYADELIGLRLSTLSNAA